MATLTFGVDETYNFKILDLILDAQKLVYGCFDKIVQEDNNARLAVRKLRTRMYSATQSAKKTAIKLASSKDAAADEESRIGKL